MLRNVERTIDLEDETILNPGRYQKIVWQRRFMAAATVCTLIGIIAYLIAVAWPKWAHIDFQHIYGHKVHVNLGVWGEYRKIENGTAAEWEWMPHFPTPPDDVMRLANYELGHYYRAQAAFCIISLALMLFNNGLALWTFFNHRYMYKRLVAGLHLLIAMCIVVTIEVLVNSVNEWNDAITPDREYFNDRKFGPCTAIAWFVFAIYLVAAFIFAVASHKHKGSRAATTEFEMEDREMYISR